MKLLFLSITTSIVYFLLSIPYGDYIVEQTEEVNAPVEYLFDDYKQDVMVSTPRFSREEVLCLQKNIFFEAATEDVIGQIAVGLVTLNRVNSNKFPDTICDVITQAMKDRNGNPIKHKCQFSWYCDGLSDNPDLSNEYVKRVWDEIGELAEHLANDNHEYAHVGDSLFYHVDGITTPWSDAFNVHSVVGSHVFYTMN